MMPNRWASWKIYASVIKCYLVLFGVIWIPMAFADMANTAAFCAWPIF